MVGKSLDMKVIEVIPDRNRLIFSALEAQSERHKKRIAALEKGQIIDGRVASVVDFGVFVDLDGVDGLVHISQLAWKKVKHPSELVNVGDDIQVKITDIDAERERISLSRKALLPSPWESIDEVYHVGDYIEVVITRVVDFGAFARLEEGIEGLIHSSQVGYSSAQNIKEAVKSGDRVLVKVLEVNPERRRMALSMRQVSMEKQISWAMDNLPEAPKPAPASQDEVPASAAEETSPDKTEQALTANELPTDSDAPAAEPVQVEDTAESAQAEVVEETAQAETVDEPTKAEAADEPVQTQTVDEPTKAEAADEPAQAQAVEEPTKAEAAEESAQAQAVEEPAQVEAVEESAQAQTVDEPAKVETVDKPAQAKAVEEPAKVETVDKPAQAKAVEEPAKIETAVEESAQTEAIAEVTQAEAVAEPAQAEVAADTAQDKPSESGKPVEEQAAI
jgi:predicted RNA-binding protein with RPS1 domain